MNAIGPIHLSRTHSVQLRQGGDGAHLMHLYPSLLNTILRRIRIHPPISHRLHQPGAAFAGHSLGEFSAFAAVVNIPPNFSLVDIVFYRSLTMQHAVEHDERGRSNHAMCAVNPSRVGETSDDAALREMPSEDANPTLVIGRDNCEPVSCRDLPTFLSVVVSVLVVSLASL